MPPDEFGAWGQWAGAIFAAVAVAVALWVALGDARRQSREQADRERERREQRGQQARTVIATVAFVNRSANPDLDDDEWGTPTLVVTVRNYGALPITNVYLLAIELAHAGEKRTLWHRYRDDLRSEPRVVEVIGTQDELEFDLFVAAVDGDVWARIAFIDADGLAWTRERNARPVALMNVHGPEDA